MFGNGVETGADAGAEASAEARTEASAKAGTETGMYLGMEAARQVIVYGYLRTYPCTKKLLWVLLPRSLAIRLRVAYVRRAETPTVDV